MSMPSCTAPSSRRRTRSDHGRTGPPRGPVDRKDRQPASGLAVAEPVAAGWLPDVDVVLLDTVDDRPAPSRRLMLPSMKAPASIARLSWMMSPITRAVLAITTDLAFTAPSTVPHTRTLSQLMWPFTWAPSPTVRVALSMSPSTWPSTWISPSLFRLPVMRRSALMIEGTPPLAVPRLGSEDVEVNDSGVLELSLVFENMLACREELLGV